MRISDWSSDVCSSDLLLTSYQGPGEDDRPSTWDLHAGNITLRGDTPVLTDVLFDERDWEVMRSQDPDGRTAGTGHSARHISQALAEQLPAALDRKSTRLNSSH